MGVDAWLPRRGSAPLDLPFFRPTPPPPAGCRSTNIHSRAVPRCPVALPLSFPGPPNSPPQPRVTLYLFRAPSDRPSAAGTESTWRFRWDLTARGSRPGRETGEIRPAHPPMYRERSERAIGSIRTGRFSISAGLVVPCDGGEKLQMEKESEREKLPSPP